MGKAASKTRHREMLVVLLTFVFIESNGLMSQQKLNEARRRMQSRFTGGSDEQPLLRELTAIIEADQELRRGFDDIMMITSRLSHGIEIVEGKLSYLIQYLRELDASGPEDTEFFSPLIRFTTRFRERITRFDLDLKDYLDIQEERARAALEFSVAETSSRRLRERLSSATLDETMRPIDEHRRLEKSKNFDHESAQRRLSESEKEVIAMARQMLSVLTDLKAMCQMAMNPDMRDTAAQERAEDLEVDDVFSLFTAAFRKHPRISSIGDFIIYHFTLMQRTYGLLRLDYENFESAVAAIPSNPAEYFEAKDDDQDLTRKHHRLRMSEGLLPFLTRAEEMASEAPSLSISDWSRRLSTEISDPDRPWSHVYDALLVAKVAAINDLASPVAR